MNLSFKGLARTAQVADLQDGGTCWLEAIENMIQLFYGDTLGSANHLSNIIKATMIADKYPGYLIQEDNVDNPSLRYPEILAAFGIDTKWWVCGKENSFNHDFLMKELDSNKGVLARVDVGYFSCYKGQKGNHCIVITDYGRDNQGNLWYYGLDSNFESMTCWWPAVEIQNALNYKDSAKIGHGQLLITTESAKWPHKSK